MLLLSIVFASVVGGVPAGLTATVVAVLADVLTLRPAISLHISEMQHTLYAAIFVAVGVPIAIVAGSIGALGRRVEAERSRLAVTLSCIGDAVISTDVTGRVLFLNPAAERATGWSCIDARGKMPEEVFRIVNQRTRATVEDPLRKALESGEIAGLVGRTVLLRRDGTEIPISDSAAPIRDYHGKMIGSVMVFRDTTAETERDAAWLQAQRLASVGRLAATIAHEINNPLQATSNLLFLISRGEDLATVQRHALAASQELLRASEIAQQTLSFVRSPGEREFVSVSRLFDEVVSLYGNKLKNKNVKVIRQFAANTIIEARRGEIRQVLGNLIGNAVDALPENGHLYLRARPLQIDGRAMVQFVVADTGTGISVEDFPRIYEPFFTTKKDVGTGLGLWVARKIVENELGALQIRSRSGSGTVARVCWPAAIDHVDSALEHAPAFMKPVRMKQALAGS